MDLLSSQLDYLRSLGFRILAEKVQRVVCPDLSHEAVGAPCPTCLAYWSDSGAYRLPEYGGDWDEQGPVEQAGSRSARRVTTGPSCMHLHGHLRYEGVSRVSFASRDEWFYDPPRYGQLAKNSWSGRRSRRVPNLSPEHKAAYAKRKAQRENDASHNLASLISEAYCLSGLHGCAMYVEWPVACRMCGATLPPS